MGGDIDPGSGDVIDQLEMLALFMELEEELRSAVGSEGLGGAGSEPPAPPPPPPPAGPGRPGRGRGGGVPRYCHYSVAGLDGNPIGYILFNENSNTFDAHCSRHGKDCAVSKSCRAFEGDAAGSGKRLAQGRPLGFLVAWLRYGTSDLFGDGPEHRKHHFDARLRRGPHALLMDGEGPLRRGSRAWVQSNPHFEPLRRAERKQRPGEAVEPPGPI
ncbi:unnamed protein product [Prorocentrum cordatum]|uniref:Uncharacterized protein n=1 Tax=Prorocentrum cordatum TaxID=2364126 RepID=A0ABN9QFL8_9DINO|nr:unnamed protein product [Polarella glacialis]